MNKVIIIALLLVGSLLLIGCANGESAVYSHLQDQNPGEVHKTGDDSLPEIKGDDDESAPVAVAICKDEFTPQEIAFRDREQRAITENDPSMCLDLPGEPLIIDCPDQALILYYSKQRCLEHFME